MASYRDQAAGDPPKFTIVLRGYDQEAVDQAVERLASTGLTEAPTFPLSLRGYERTQVDAYFRRTVGTRRGTPGIARLRAVVLDTPDPRGLAEFYRALVGGEITDDDGEWVTLRDGGAVKLSFQLAPDYRPPVWPSAEHGQQFHIDVTVDDIDAADAQVLALGAREHEVQPREGENWRVYLDPVGHPFCLCWD